MELDERFHQVLEALFYIDVFGAVHRHQEVLVRVERQVLQNPRGADLRVVVTNHFVNGISGYVDAMTRDPLSQEVLAAALRIGQQYVA